MWWIKFKTLGPPMWWCWRLYAMMWIRFKILRPTIWQNWRIPMWWCWRLYAMMWIRFKVLRPTIWQNWRISLDTWCKFNLVWNFFINENCILEFEICLNSFCKIRYFLSNMYCTYGKYGYKAFGIHILKHIIHSI